MGHYAQNDKDDVLSRLSELLRQLAEAPGDLCADADSKRFCRDASVWLQAVRGEVAQLLGHWASGVQSGTAASQTAEVFGRVCADAPTLVRPVGQPRVRHEVRAQETSASGAESPPSGYIAQAESIRADVANFRAQLRAERAERARQAAEERRRFVEGLRSEVRPAAPKPEREVREGATGLSLEQDQPSERAQGLAVTADVEPDPVGTMSTRGCAFRQVAAPGPSAQGEPNSSVVVGSLMPTSLTDVLPSGDLPQGSVAQHHADHGAVADAHRCSANDTEPHEEHMHSNSPRAPQASPFCRTDRR